MSSRSSARNVGESACFRLSVDSRKWQMQVGDGGFEPPLHGPKPRVLPLTLIPGNAWRESNPRPADSKSAALSTELQAHDRYSYLIGKVLRWTWRASISLPPGCKAGALPIELQALEPKAWNRTRDFLFTREALCH